MNANLMYTKDLDLKQGVKSNFLPCKPRIKHHVNVLKQLFFITFIICLHKKALPIY